jgi:ketopantoate reductase
MTETATLPAVYVIGMGEVGTRLEQALRRTGVETSTVTRRTGWSEALADTHGLYLVCVREHDLAEVLGSLKRVPPDRIVLVQNGWIRPLLHSFPGVTRGLIWFTAKGDFFTVLRSSPFSGPVAQPLTDTLTTAGIPSKAVDISVFDRFDADKMAFNCVVGLPLAVHGLSLGEYLERRRDEARAVFEEALTVCAAALGIMADGEAWEKFLLSAQPLGWVRVANAKALGFRNGAVVELARLQGGAAPVNSELMSCVKNQWNGAP